MPHEYTECTSFGSCYDIDVAKRTRKTSDGGIASQVVLAERSLRRIEREMMALQSKYETIAARRNTLVRLARNLRTQGIEADGTLTWATVCRVKGWRANGSAHVVVKRLDPRLHVLLHQAALGERCQLDRATYPLQ